MRLDAEPDRVDRAEAGVGDEHRPADAERPGEVDRVAVVGQGRAGSARALDQGDVAGRRGRDLGREVRDRDRAAGRARRRP